MNKEGSLSKTFDDIYRYRRWGYGSGPGSIYIFNKCFIKFVNGYLKKHKDIKRVVDIGCGDWQIAKHFDLKNINYVGCDVSKEALSRSSKYSSKNIEFQHIDAIKDRLPDGDLVIIKEVLHHLSNKSVQKILSKFSKYKYVIIQNNIEENQLTNSDIKDGKYRALDVQKPPINSKRYKLVKTYSEGLLYLYNLMEIILNRPLTLRAIFVSENS